MKIRHETSMALSPRSIADAPALIETVFPARNASFEAQRERKAGPGQTFTALSSYRNRRNPLILAGAIVPGRLLPTADDGEADFAVFEKRTAVGGEGLPRRALASGAF